jgi:hypothetical protein
MPPWAPVGVTDLENADLRYLVVDEIVGPSVGLVLSPWPAIDEQGRLRFAEAGGELVGCLRADLERFLSEHRLPEALRERPLRIGDVFAVCIRQEVLAEFAAELREQRRLEPFLGPERWIEPPVYDVTADAREEAKVAFYAAVTPLLDSDQAERLAETAAEETQR